MSSLSKIKQYALAVGGFAFMPVSRLMPRDAHKWMFGGVENALYLVRLGQLRRRGIRAIWVATSRQEVERMRAQGIEAVRKLTPRYFYHVATSRLIVITHGVSQVTTWFRWGARVVNVWHGIPYKKIALDDTKHLPSTYLERLTSPTTTTRVDLQLSSSPTITRVLHTCFHYTPKVAFVETQQPRNVILFRTPDEIVGLLTAWGETRLIAYVERMKRYRQVIIYMPTFRDNASDFLLQGGFDLTRLEETCKAMDALFVFKLHRNTQSAYLKDIDRYPHLMIIDNQSDVYPLLPFTTTLITDYSSIYFDYILMPAKRVIFYTFDYDEYLREDRETYFPPTIMQGEYCYDFDSLLHSLQLTEWPEVGKDKVIDTVCSRDTTLDPLVEAMIKCAER